MRGNYAQQRRQSIDDRVQESAVRDALAHARDVAALARDQIAALHDREIAARDAAWAGTGRALTAAAIVDRAFEDHTRAADDRAAAAEGRARAASDRDRLLAQADREALLHMLAVAETDVLTGARTRAAGLADLEHEIERARRAIGPLVVAYIDVVGLKAINDTKGHAAGDALLQRVVRAIRSHMRSYDLIVRLGGDEFLCAMSGANRNEARSRFRSVRKALADGPDPCEIKVGFAALSPEDDADALIQRADAELPATPHGSLRAKPPHAEQ